MRGWFLFVLCPLLLSACGSSPSTGGGEPSDAAAEVSSPPDGASSEIPVIPDAGVDEDSADGGDVCAPGAGQLCPCEGGGDCPSGVCTFHQGEQVCAPGCVQGDCPEGWGCAPPEGGDPVASVCASLYPSLCVPCDATADCFGDDHCFVHDDGAGAFCSPWCGADLTCPSGYSCHPLETIDGVAGEACVWDDGDCPCSATSVQKHKTTACQASNAWGSCDGARVCETGGLSPCSAPIPAEEACGDGVDNDCDGLTDPPALCPGCQCGDGVCEPVLCGEAWEPELKTCALDCAVCGDDVCDPGEGPAACPADCCGSCGDGKCKCSEDPDACPEDCGQWACGDGTCNPGENPVDCPQDCEPYVCGNGTCEPGEDPASCPDDCGSACGNCECEGGESYADCPVDCGFCGDGYCIAKCDYAQETPDVCPADCGEVCATVCDGRECDHWGLGNQCDCGTCDDGDACTEDTCAAQGLCVFNDVLCEDGDPCTVDTCDPASGCGALPGNEGGPCADGAGTCIGGACCVPNCAGLTCGDDGCAGSCGACGDDEYCNAGQCLPLCGNGLCVDAGETCVSCPGDCGPCPGECDPPCDASLEECVPVTTGGGACAAKMVSIAAGSFWMGCNNCADSSVNDATCGTDEHSYHEVLLDGYEIDRTEVTADQYAACVATGECLPPGTGQYSTWQQAGMGDHPINYLTWDLAGAYCLWAGKSLCTEAQWEKGARGGCEHNGGASCKADSRKYPWGGDTATCSLAVKSGCQGDTKPACSLSPAGDSPYGLCDMAGNVWEWVADLYQKDYYCDGGMASGDQNCLQCGTWPGSPAPWTEPQGPSVGVDRLFRGGSFADGSVLQRVSFRYVAEPTSSFYYLGLRCCR